MTIRKIAILSLALLLPFTIEAQKKKKRVVKKPTVEVVCVWFRFGVGEVVAVCLWTT